MSTVYRIRVPSGFLLFHYVQKLSCNPLIECVFFYLLLPRFTCVTIICLRQRLRCCTILSLCIVYIYIYFFFIYLFLVSYQCSCLLFDVYYQFVPVRIAGKWKRRRQTVSIPGFISPVFSTSKGYKFIFICTF